MRAFMRRLFGTWTGFGEYVVFLSVCIAGILHASWFWILIGGLCLFLLGWPRWGPLIGQAGRIDAECRDLGMLMWQHRIEDYGLRYFAHGVYHVPLIIGAKLGFDCLYLTGAYIFGVAAGWFWGV
jgi:hypothetical protein